ncbi:hypothetical protein BC833DRAFT_595651 [Globomyces pollinis-pini]|nr:hypothetical protein BC833DRAFT_595651 [Globomyces pollinis-pini]
MYFCPICSNVLLLDNGGENKLFCQSCPYICRIDKPLTNKTKFTAKQVDDVLGGAQAWDNVDSTEVSCPQCEHNRAYFMQIQIRSADEPSTLFYKCCECAHDWREN